VTRRPFVRIACAGAILVAAVPAIQSRAEPRRYAVVVQGASGEPQYATLHRRWAATLAGLLGDRFKFDRAAVQLLTEQPAAGEVRATAENVRAAFARLASVVTADDLVFVTLIGHGTAAGGESKFNLVGPDLTVAEWAALLKPLRGRLVFVDATSASFPFLAGLAGPNRVVITATNSVAQQFHTVFAEGFVQALASTPADADKNGRVSILEAFQYASRQVELHYEQSGHLSTERAVLDDTGDGVGRDAATSGPDGNTAAFTYLDVVEVPRVSDPALQALLEAQQRLIESVDDLRRRRGEVPALLFEAEFEKLMVELALVSRAIRQKGKRP
jgi:hypothetical protein